MKIHINSVLCKKFFGSISTCGGAKNHRNVNWLGREMIAIFALETPEELDPIESAHFNIFLTGCLQ